MSSVYSLIVYPTSNFATIANFLHIYAYTVDYNRKSPFVVQHTVLINSKLLDSLYAYRHTLNEITEYSSITIKQ